MAEILVVDDSVIDRNAMSNALLNAGFSITTAKDGKEALAKLRKDSQLRMMIVDLIMPDMNGIELVKAIREEMGNDELKVLVASSDTSSAVQTNCKGLKISSWILKPVRMDVATMIIAKLLSENKN